MIKSGRQVLHRTAVSWGKAMIRIPSRAPCPIVRHGPPAQQDVVTQFHRGPAHRTTQPPPRLQQRPEGDDIAVGALVVLSEVKQAGHRAAQEFADAPPDLRTREAGKLLHRRPRQGAVPAVDARRSAPGQMAKHLTHLQLCVGVVLLSVCGRDVRESVGAWRVCRDAGMTCLVDGFHRATIPDQRESLPPAPHRVRRLRLRPAKVVHRRQPRPGALQHRFAHLLQGPKMVWVQKVPGRRSLSERKSKSGTARVMGRTFPAVPASRG